MIRILHVIGAMDRGGAETMIMNFYRHIDRSKFTFDFLVCADRKCDYDDEILELGGKIYRIPFFKGINYFSYYQAGKNFFEEHHDYDIVHGHIGSSAKIYLKLAKKYGMVTVAHSHNTNFTLTLEGFLLKILSFNTRYIADYFFGCSLQAGIDRFGKKKAYSNRFTVINNGINAKNYCYSQSRNEMMKKQFNLTNHTVYGHIGRFIEIKNHTFLLDVFYKIYQKNHDSILVLVGRGPTEEKIKEKVKELGLEEAVLFLGIRSDIPDLLNLFDCFVFPSKYEGLGIALIEAQAAGLPCVISDQIPKEAYVTNGVFPLSLTEGKLVWAEKCVSIFNSFERKNTYQEILSSGFDIQESTRMIEAKYEEFIKKKN